MNSQNLQSPNLQSNPDNLPSHIYRYLINSNSNSNCCLLPITDSPPLLSPPLLSKFRTSFRTQTNTNRHDPHELSYLPTLSIKKYTTRDHRPRGFCNVRLSIRAWGVLVRGKKATRERVFSIDSFGMSKSPARQASQANCKRAQKRKKTPKKSPVADKAW